MPNSLQSLGGFSQLALECTGGLIRAVERMHATIAARVIPWTTTVDSSKAGFGPFAKQIYGTLEAAHGLLADTVTRAFRSISPIFPAKDDSGSVSAAAILNGICGDHLEATQNPLAIRMSLRTLDGAIELFPERIASTYARVSPHVAVWVHGLFLSEQNWILNGGDSMGERLQNDLDITPVYVRYNSGRHISTNGRELSDQLERMMAAWPLPIASLTLIGHSMGGLVARSASWYGDREGRAWSTKLRNVVCLGAPHHGAPLEKGGELVTRAMQASPYLSPLVFGHKRSAGIKDLRHGNLLDEDWPSDNCDGGADCRIPVPLIPRVNYFFAAATVGRNAVDLKGQVLGDLLVLTASAIGAHPDHGKQIPIAPENCRIFRGMNHFDLLDHPQVYEQLVRWLAQESGRQVSR